MTAVSVLLSRWFLAVLWVVAVLPLITLGVVEVRRHRRHSRGVHTASRAARWSLRAIVVTLSLVLGLAATADAVNRHFRYLPSFAALFGTVSRDYVSHPIAGNPRLATHRETPSRGVAEEIAIDGPASGVHGRHAFVYLPPQYFDPVRPFRRFPVLYMLHGTPGEAADWLRSGRLDVTMDTLLATGRIRPFIVVMPDVNGGFLHDTECADAPGGPRVQTYLTADVVHAVDARFRTIPNRLDRAIGGLSTGGYCATNLTLRHQDVFSASISHSGNLRPEHSVFTGRLFASRADEMRNTPADYLRTIAIRQPLAMYFDTGANDAWARGPSIWGARVLRDRGVTTTLHVYPDSGHTWGTWSRALYDSLPWVSNWFTHPALAAPAPRAVPASRAVPATRPVRHDL